MATEAECVAALQDLSAAMRHVDPETARSALPRTVSCHVTDLDVTFTGRLEADGFHDMSSQPAPGAQIRLAVTSDDLVALSRGELDFARSWRQGRVRVHASLGDLFKLRKLF